MRRWRILVDARIEIVEEGETGMDAELAVIAALRDRSASGGFRSLDWSEAYVVPGSAVEIVELVS